MHRRQALALFAALGAAPSLVAQPTRAARVGILMYGSAANAAARIDAFTVAMKELGYEAGRNVFYERRMANGQEELLLAEAREFSHAGLDVIVSGSAPATVALRKVNTTTPVVLAAAPDTVPLPDHLARHVELLHSIAPRVTRISVLLDPAESAYPAYRSRLQGISPAARAAPIDATTAAQVESALARHDENDGLLVTNATLFYNERRTIAETAARLRRPAIYPLRGYVEAGGLMSWGPNPEATFARAAHLVDRVLKGKTDPAAEMPPRFELVVNREAMKDLGLALPAELARQAVMLG